MGHPKGFHAALMMGNKRWLPGHGAPAVEINDGSRRMWPQLNRIRKYVRFVS